MMLAVFLFFWTFHYHTILINGAGTDLSMLTPNQIQIWHKAISQANDITHSQHIEIVHLGHGVEIRLFKDQYNTTHQNRYLFKQNVNKRVDWYLYEDQYNPSVSSHIYDRCHGALSSLQTPSNLAGIYIYTNNQTGYGLGIIVVAITNMFQWYNNSKPYTINEETILNNGTQLLLAFEATIYYNANSDLLLYNKQINEIVQQAYVSIENNLKTNLESFISMKDLSCERHEQIVYNELRLIIFACTVQVTFKCPLERIGSSCWLENKSISNIRLNIGSLAFISDRTITLQIDV